MMLRPSSGATNTAVLAHPAASYGGHVLGGGQGAACDSHTCSAETAGRSSEGGGADMYCKVRNRKGEW